MKRRFAVVMVVVMSASALGGVALAASSPAVSTRAASSVKQTSAVLNGTVNPNGSGTTYFFQWGLTTGYGVTGSTHSAGAGTKTVSAHQTASGLIPGTVYHYRLVATNKFGTSAGADRTFKTTGHPPPGVSTGPASQLGTNFATVTGVINPNGESTTWEFQYGLTTSYTAKTTGGTVPAGNGPVTVAQTLQGLEKGTIFHYRLVGFHGATVTSVGSDQIFMTFPSPRPVPHVSRRTVPSHAKTKPFTFTTSGSVSHPSSIPSQFACSGEVGIRYFTGGQRVAFAVVPLEPNCTYSSKVVFNHRPGRAKPGRVTLHVLVHFRGNGYLAPANARNQTVKLG